MKCLILIFQLKQLVINDIDLMKYPEFNNYEINCYTSFLVGERVQDI